MQQYFGLYVFYAIILKNVRFLPYLGADYVKYMSKSAIDNFYIMFFA